MPVTAVVIDAEEVEVVIDQEGPAGVPGAGIPDGGTAGQSLVKASGSDYDTGWADPSPAISSPYVVATTTTAAGQFIDPGDGTLEIGQEEYGTGLDSPVVGFFKDNGAGALLQVWWIGGRRVYQRGAGAATGGGPPGFPHYSIPVSVLYATGALPAVGTPVYLTSQGRDAISNDTAAGTLTEESAATVLLVLKADGTFVRKLTALVGDIGKVLGVVDDGDGNPVLGWVTASTTPTYSPSLNYSDGRNSQYSLFPLLGW